MPKAGILGVAYDVLALIEDELEPHVKRGITHYFTWDKSKHRIQEIIGLGEPVCPQPVILNPLI